MATAKTALVTGANGHVGNNLVKALLERGYRVRASVRNAGDAAKTSMLPKDGIEIVSLDVQDGKQFAAVCQGVDVVFHVAASFAYHISSRATEEMMIRDSVEGARSAMRAAAANGVDRVVLTSAAFNLPMVARGGRQTTEEDWRDDLRVPAYRAKIMAEREAWRLAEELGVNLTTVLPGVIFGPGFGRPTMSARLVESMQLGALRMGAPDTNLPVVDVRDAVMAHVLAAETGGNRRYVICNDDLPSIQELTRIMHRIDPAAPESKRVMPDFALALAPAMDWVNHWALGTARMLSRELISATRGKVWTVSNARAKRELGWRQTIPLQQSLADTMAALRRLGEKKAA